MEFPAHFLALNKHNLECYATYTLDTLYISKNEPNVIFKWCALVPCQGLYPA